MGCFSTLLCLSQRGNSLGYLKESQQTNASQNRDAQGCHGNDLYQDELQDSSAHHKAIKAVEERHEVLTEAQGIHLQNHLHRKEGQKYSVSHICKQKSFTSDGRTGYVLAIRSSSNAAVHRIKTKSQWHSWWCDWCSACSAFWLFWLFLATLCRPPPPPVILCRLRTVYWRVIPWFSSWEDTHESSFNIFYPKA